LTDSDLNRACLSVGDEQTSSLWQPLPKTAEGAFERRLQNCEFFEMRRGEAIEEIFRLRRKR